MTEFWVPGVNRLGAHGRWAFAELTDVWAMQHEFAKALTDAFESMLVPAPALAREANHRYHHHLMRQAM